MRVRSQAFTIIAFLCALLSASSVRADAGIGDAAPAFVVKTLDGKTFDLSTQKGKVVIVNFWATWSPPCRWEMPALEAVWRQYHSKGLVMVAVSADRPRAHHDVVNVMHYFSFPAAMLDAVTKNDLVTITSVPVTYVIGKDGKVENILTPPLRPLTEAGLNDEVKALLDAKYEAKPETKKNPKTGTKPDTLFDDKPLKPDANLEIQPDAKSDTTQETKPETKSDIQPDAQPGIQLDDAETKPEAKP